MPSHKIGTDEFYGVQADWQPIEQYQLPDGTIEYSDWYNLTWELGSMTMDDYETLKAYQGTALTSITTNQHDNLNAFYEYDTAILESVVNSLHVGLVAKDISIKFKVFALVDV